MPRSSIILQYFILSLITDINYIFVYSFLPNSSECVEGCASTPHIPMAEDDVHLKGQSATLRLDWFVHTLVVKCISAVGIRERDLACHQEIL